MKRTFTKYPSSYVKAYSDSSNNPSMYIDIPQPQPIEPKTDDEIKKWVSLELIGIHNAPLENIVRTALFDNSSVIDWQNVYREILRQNPQFNGVLEDNSDNANYRW